MSFNKPNVVWIVLGLTILQNVFDQTSGAYLRCYRDSFTNYTEVPIIAPDSLLTDPDPCLDKNKPTIFLANGFANDPDHGPAIQALMTTYISLGTYNPVLVNWAVESKGIGPGIIGYPTAALNTAIVGNELAAATVKLVSLGMSTDIVYVGHSLGAHLLGYAGRATKKQNLIIPRLFALDPARLFFEPPTLFQPVDTTSSNLTVVVHCDVGGYALNQTLGHVDIWTNYGHYLNGDRRQPGCALSLTIQELGTHGNLCSHNRCWQYFNVSLTDHDLFKAGQAKDYYDWVAHNGQFNDINYIGPKVDPQEEGEFFCSTSGTYPWGLQDAGLVPQDN